jgi:cobalamin biosynthesis protein CobD/CbiB
VNASPDDRQGTDLLLQEIREEAGRLVHHPVAEIKRLEDVVEEGESAATPLLLFVGVAMIVAVIAAVVMTVVFFAYYET